VVGCSNVDPANPFLTTELSSERAGSILDEGPVASEPLDLGHLSDREWVEQPPQSYARRRDNHRRWHHARLNGYLNAHAPRIELTEALGSTNPVMAANAAIVAAYWGEGDQTQRLATAIRTKNLPVPLRCAAAEALGFVQEPSPAPTLRELVSQVRTPDLHADLLRALARHAEPGDEKWFAMALANPAWQVRLEAVAAWRSLGDAELPAEAIELRRDRDPRVRAVALRTIAGHRDERAAVYLQEAMADEDLDVRAAATAGLREIGTADARALVERVKGRGADLQQAANLAADAANSLKQDLHATADDAQTQLRAAVTETLDQAEQRGRELAAQGTAAAEESVRQASAQVDAVVDEANAVAGAASARAREIQQLAASLREANLPEAARRQAVASLERLAADASAEVRVRAAEAMGEAADPKFLPALMALLSDEPDVQVAAMAALVQIAGTDVAAADGRSQTNDDRVRAWQLWYRDQQNRTGG
jgi:HEAT repeat protein